MKLDRTRSYSWDDPQISFDAAQRLDGLAFMHAIIAGELPQPPIARTLGFELIEAEKGRCVFAGQPGEFLLNPHGAVHGGYFGVLLDSAMGCAVGSTLAAGQAHTTLEYKINTVRGMTAATGLVRTEGWVVHAGRRTATAEGRIVDAKGRILGHGNTTCIILS